MKTDNPDPTGSALAHKRWDKISQKERSEYARMMNGARWAGHKAKRPASSRKKKAI